MTTRTFATAAILAGMALAAVSGAGARAATITDLFNTGVDGAGVALGDGVADSHYALISDPISGGLIAQTIIDTPGAFVPDDANSRWIAPSPIDAQTNGHGPNGQYIYRTTFTLPGTADLTTVVITGLWATDNTGDDILINGVSTGQLNTTQFGSFTNFSITSDFVVGVNTIDFIVFNILIAGGNNPTGLHIDSIAGSYDEVAASEPAALAVLGIGLAGFGALRRRKSRQTG